MLFRSLADGKIDVVVGTHRLVQEDVRFRDLGLCAVSYTHLDVYKRQALHIAKLLANLLFQLLQVYKDVSHDILIDLAAIGVVLLSLIHILPMTRFM